MNATFKYIIERLSEPSTWRGIIWLVTAVGFSLNPEQREAIAAAGMTIVGLIAVFTNDGKAPPAPTQESVQEEVEEQQLKTEKAVKKVRVKLKNETPKKPESDNFFND